MLQNAAFNQYSTRAGGGGGGGRGVVVEMWYVVDLIKTDDLGLVWFSLLEYNLNTDDIIQYNLIRWKYKSFPPHPEIETS